MVQNGMCEVPGNPKEPIFLGDYSFNTGRIKAFSAIDYFVLALILIVSAVIGLYHAWKTRQSLDVKQFLLAAQSMPPFPVGMSLLASFVSAVTFLGAPSEIFTNTTMYFWMMPSYFLVAASAAHIYCPVFYRLNLTTAFEYLQKRFNKPIRTATSCCYIIQMIAYMAIVLYAPTEAFISGGQFALWVSIVSVGIICTVYTSLGGMKAVLWTDTFQIIVMIISLFIIFVRGAVALGDWELVRKANERMKKFVFDDFRLDPTVRHTVWSLVIGGYFKWVSVFGVSQAEVQRAVACDSLKDAQFAIWMAFPGLCIILLLCCFTGLYMNAFYENCDPVKAKIISKHDELLPLFVMDMLSDFNGLPGFFVASVFCGSLSTISSGLNSVSTSVMEDIFMNHNLFFITENNIIFFAKLTSMFIGALSLGLTPLAAQVDNVLQATLTIHGLMGAPMLGVFSLGMFFPWANSQGALAGLFGSVAVIITITVGTDFFKTPTPHVLSCVRNCNFDYMDNSTSQLAANAKGDHESGSQLFYLSYMWSAPTAFATCIVIGLAVSLATGAQNPRRLHPYLFVPLCDVVFPFYYLPESIRKPLRFNVGHERSPFGMHTYFGTRSSTESDTVQSGNFEVPHDISIKEDIEQLDSSV